MKKLILGLLASLALSGCGGDNTLSGSASSSASSTSSSSNSSATAAVATVTLVSDVSTIPSDGSSDATITAYVRDTNGGLLDGVDVTFVIPANNGGISPSSTTTTDGVATASLITAGDSTLRTISVTAVAGGISAATSVQVVSATSTNTVQLGSGTGTGFQAGVLDMGIAASGTLSAGGTAVITANLVQTDGSLYTGSVNVTFSSSCIAAGTSVIDEGNTANTTTGEVRVTYRAKGCISDAVTARATVGGNALSASGSLTIAPATVGSIIFVSATPSSIALKGAGTSTMPETAVVKFQVLDSQNNALPNRAVDFALNTSIGGVALTDSSDTSDSSGYVEAIVNSGTVATSVRVTATVASSSISTQSSNLTITTGLPDQDSFSLALTCNNLEAWNYDGVTTGATVYLADRYNNPVPDDTAITFQTEAGDIGGSCVTSGGACSVTWRSSGTRPSNGRVSILATAIGEETFVDVNGNGIFDSGDTFTEAGVSTDPGEPFEDNNENGLYDSGEPFRDFNQNSTRNGADGAFNGYCSTSVSGCSSTQSTAIGAKAIIVMSGNEATIVLRNANDYVTGVAGTNNVDSIALGTTVSTYYAAVYDLHGNPMPSGTTVSISSTNGTLSGTTSYTVGCTAQSAYTYTAGTTLFPVKITKDTTSSSGALSIKVTTPKATVTTLDIDVTD